MLCLGWFSTHLNAGMNFLASSSIERECEDVKEKEITIDVNFDEPADKRANVGRLRHPESGEHVGKPNLMENLSILNDI